jgi:hypothetical protein
MADLALMQNGDDDFVAFGALSRGWLETRTIGSAEVRGRYADVYALNWVQHLRTALAGIALKLGMNDVDLSMLERAEPRILTQRAGREAYTLGFDGVYYHSRYGQDIENWAIFEFDGFPVSNRVSRPIAADDPDLREAVRIFGLVFVD